MPRIPSLNSLAILASALLALTSAIQAPAIVASTSHPQHQQARTLTFADRVAYQYAIEEVYWQHRIWPKENKRPKPSLDEVMSAAQIEKKVEDYLRDSQLLENQWQCPITSGQLQGEMDRMAQHTRQPEVLHELFTALGNDPRIIAECLVRPVITAGLIGDARDMVKPRGLVRTNSVRAISMSPKTPNYSLPEISGETPACLDDSWASTSTVNAPPGRGFTTATTVWTGSEMIIWGGTVDGAQVDTGARYSPITDTWMVTNGINAPSPRESHTAVWTGNEMIVWGGHRNGFGYPTNGARYNPSTDSWTATSTSAPPARDSHSAVWTGSEMIVWGGFRNNQVLNTGGRYNPESDSWLSTPVANAPAARLWHTAVWSGSEMIIWGGSSNGGTVPLYNTGGKYNPTTNTWTATNAATAPPGREFNTVVWTGSEMIVWGGYNPWEGGYLNAGARYNPMTDNWTTTSPNALNGREFHTAVWTGREMIIWGGRYIINGTTSVPLNTGGRYNPGNDSWILTAVSSAPEARLGHTAVWTGSEMIIWGGYGTSDYLDSGGRYCAQPSTPIAQSADSRKTHGTAGNFDVDLPLNGTPGIECRSGGLTNDYTMVITFLANVSVNGNPQAAVTLGTGIVGTGGVSNGGMITISGNVVTIPLTGVTNAQTINVTLNSVNGSTNVVIPMNVLIGDANGNGSVNASDVSQTKLRLGQTVSATNFRSDVSTNGSINASDVSIVKGKVGTGLP